MRKLIYCIIFALALLSVCDAVPFRQKRQIEDQTILNNDISQHDVDQSSDLEDGVDDSLPIVNNVNNVHEVTEASTSNVGDTVGGIVSDRDADAGGGILTDRDSDVVEINEYGDDILTNRGLPETDEDVNLNGQNVGSINEDYSELDDTNSDPVLHEIFRETSGNHSDHDSDEIEDSPEFNETTSRQHFDDGNQNHRNLEGETNNQHFLLGEVDTDGNQILHMTDTSHERLYTLAVEHKDGEHLDTAGYEHHTSEHQYHNDTEAMEHDWEHLHNETDENHHLVDTDGTESGTGSEHLDAGTVEGSGNSTSGQQEGNVDGLNNVDHSHETELNGHNNENPDNSGQDNSVDYPIDKGTHPHGEQGIIEPIHPPRHSYTPLTDNTHTNISTTTEPTFESRTNPTFTPLSLRTEAGVLSVEPLIPTITTTTERSTPDENLDPASGGTDEHEHIGGTGESHIHGIDGESSGEGPDTYGHSEIPEPETTGNPNAVNGNEENEPKESIKDATKLTSAYVQSSSSFPSINPTIETRDSTTPLSTSYQGAFEKTSTIETSSPDVESVSGYDVQTIEYNYYSDYYPDSVTEVTSSQSTYTSSAQQTIELVPTMSTYSNIPTASRYSPIYTTSSLTPTSSQPREISSISSVFPSSSRQYPEIVPTSSSLYHTILSQTASSSEFDTSSQPDTTYTSKQPSYILIPSEHPSTMASTAAVLQTPIYTPGMSQSISSSSSQTTTRQQMLDVSSTATIAPSSLRLYSTSASVTASTPRMIQTLPIVHTTNKKDEPTTNLTTTVLTTRKKSDSGKVSDKPENASSTVQFTASQTSTTSLPVTTHTPLPWLHATTYQKVDLSTPPSSYIVIELRMDWYEFYSSKVMFVSQIRNIIQHEKEITVPPEQFKITSQDSNPTIEDRRSITIQMYIVDNDGKIDVSLTLVTSDLIVKGFQGSDYFKDKIVSVRYHPKTNVETFSHETTVRKTSSPDATMVIVIAAVGGVCFLMLIILQILIHRRVKFKKNQRHLMSHHRTSIRSLDHVALGVIPKSRPGSGYWNHGLDHTLEVLEPKEFSHVLNFSLLANFCMDPTGIHAEFQSIPFDSVESPSVVYGEEDKNRFANVLPYKHSRVKLLVTEEKSSDYINANYIRGYKGAKNTYIATQSPLVNTVEDFWRMIWEQQSRAILMINPVTQYAKPKQSTCYWPDNLETDMRREYGDFTVTLTKRDVQQDYIDCTLELMDIERNLKREVHHFWYTCWSDVGPPEPLSFVKFVLDTRPQYENSGAPVVVHCGPGTGRTGTFIAVDTCMRMFEDKRRVDILRCVHKMRNERAGAVQTREQYSLIYQTLNEYGVILSSPSISTRSSVVTLHAML